MNRIGHYIFLFDVYKVATLTKSVKEIKFAFVVHYLLFKISPIFRNLGPFGIPLDAAC